MTHQQFSKTLVAWRERNELTQQEAADQLGVSRRSLENWEQERAMPQGFGLAAMLKTIGVAKAQEKSATAQRQRAPAAKRRC